MKNNNQKQLIAAYELFDFISLFSIKTDYVTTSYNVLGIPLWKVRECKENEPDIYKTKYYFLGLPVAEISEKLSITDDAADLDETTYKQEY